MTATPIFDLERPLPRRRFRWVSYFVGIPVIFFITFLPELALGAWDNAPPYDALFLLPGLYVGILLHELGHVAAGRLAGVATGGFSVGGLVFTRSGDHWTFRFDGRCLIGGFMIPLPKTREFSRSGFIWLVTGGPLASLLYTAGCWAVVSRLGDETSVWIGSLFWTSVMLSIGALIPYQSMGLRSDVSRIWQLLRHPEEARRWFALVALNGDEMKGARPRDWDPILMEEVLQAGPREGSYAVIQLLASYRRADLGDNEAAIHFLETALESAVSAGNRRVMKLAFQWAASVSASVRHNGAQARAWLERAQRVRGGRLDDAEGIEADIAIAQQRYADALAHLAKRREGLVKRRLDSGLARFAKDRIAQREEFCRAALAMPGSSALLARDAGQSAAAQ